MVVVGIVFGSAMTACSGGSTTTVDVFAASSLTDAFTEIEDRFEGDHPDIDVRLNLAGSDTLRRQIEDGASADVFAPADLRQFELLGRDDLDIDEYASNRLELVANPRRMTAGSPPPLAQLREDEVIVARCASGVPCGDATDRLLDDLGLDLEKATLTSESDVRAVLTKVRLGEADFGFVYRTDTAVAEGDVMSTGVISATSVRLGITVLGDSDAAEEFVAFVTSDEALRVLTELGFGPPEGSG